jgi:uncharacterized Fe-S cluster-containing MiaB family protein
LHANALWPLLLSAVALTVASSRWRRVTLRPTWIWSVVGVVALGFAVARNLPVFAAHLAPV